MGTLPLRELARPGQTVAISVCDITRPMPSSRVLPVLLAELDHVPRDQISILVATGTHRSNTVEELEGMLGAEVVRNYRIVNHQSFRPETLSYRGALPSGIPVWLNSIWLDSDVRITTGFVEPHFFAGFSGGPKLVAPGLAGFDTIMELHSAPLIAHPRATWGITRGNPIHDSIREVAALSGVDFSLDVTLNRDHEITSVHAGEIFESHGSACRFAKRTAMQPVARPFDVVVTTNSGYPLDLNLYQSVKGMSAAARVVRPGGRHRVCRGMFRRDPGAWRVPQAPGLDFRSCQFPGPDPRGRRHHARPVAGPDPEPDPTQGARAAEIGRFDAAPDSERAPGAGP